MFGSHQSLSKEFLEGIWEREEDRFEGCRLKVYQDQGELLGEIIISNPAMLKAGWIIGEKKWRHITLEESGRWSLLDLRKEYNTKTFQTVSNSYAHYWLSLNGENELLLKSSKISLFSEQKWKKVGHLLVRN